MSVELARAGLVLLAANIMFFAGLLFLSGKLLRQRLAPVYQALNRWQRIAVFTVIISIPGNFLITLGYRTVDVGIAGAISAAAAVVVMVIGAMLVDRIKPSPRLIAATLLAVASCASVAWLMASLKTGV